MALDYNKYLRMDMMPHIWCPGCGDGIILKSLLRAVDRLNLDRDKVTMVSGIGCSSRLPGYVDFNTLHTTHGRALGFATGVKMAKPEMTVIVITGDGDALAIGGNHFIHAARRNIDLTVLLFNNYTYGMTGGQYSPTTPEGKYAATAPYGNIEPPFDPCTLAKACGASYVARGTTYASVQLDKLIEDGIKNKGFSLLEIMTACPTLYGRKHKMDPTEMMKWQKEGAVGAKVAEKMTPEQLEGKFITGVLHNVPRPEYTAQYATIIKKAQNGKK